MKLSHIEVLDRSSERCFLLGKINEICISVGLAPVSDYTAGPFQRSEVSGGPGYLLILGNSVALTLNMSLSNHLTGIRLSKANQIYEFEINGNLYSS